MWQTNAQYNREQGVRLYDAGFSKVEIVTAFPEVYVLDKEGKFGLIYDKSATRSLHLYSHDAREAGLLECDRMVSSEVVARMIEARRPL